MSKTVLSEINGFTPLPDVLVKHYGMMTAAVFGAVWRYCQMKDGVCRAGLEKIAGELEINQRSVIRHIRILVDAGFLEDTTPNLRNRPHTYADTGKVSMESRVGMVEGGVQEGQGAITESQGATTESQGAMTESQGAMTESQGAMTESQGAMTESQSHSDTESIEDSIKIAVKKPVKITANSGENFSKAQRKELTDNLNLEGQIFAREIEDPVVQGHAHQVEQVRLTWEKNMHYSRFDAPGWRGFDEWLLRQEEAGRPVEEFCQWFVSDEFRRKTVSNWSPNGDRDGRNSWKAIYSQAHASIEQEIAAHPEYKPYVEPFEGQYVIG